MFRSISSRVVSTFLLIVAAMIAAEWAADTLVQAESSRIFLLGVTLLLAIGCVMLLARSISGRLRKLQQMAEALRRKELPLNREDLGNDEIGAIARSLREMAPEMRRLADGLTAASAQQEAIWEGMVEGLLVVDRALKVRFCNRAFARAISGPAPAHEGAPVFHIIRDPTLLDLIKVVIQSGKPANTRIQISAAPGRSFQVRAAPLSTPAATGAVVLLLDITELERLERMRRDFVANVSHELRTPLTAIRGYAETLLDEGLEDVANRRQFVEIILANANRLNNIAADLLALSDLESGTSPAPAILSIGESVNTALQIVQAEASIRGVRLILGNVPEGLKVSGHKMRLEQALINLLDNAVKFNHSGGTVVVDATAGEDGCAHVTIEDSGIGIPSDQLSRIFERFYRVDKGRSRSVGGTGLGLSIVKHAIEQMNGTVTVESTLGHGTRFTITLPVPAVENS